MSKFRSIAAFAGAFGLSLGAIAALLTLPPVTGELLGTQLSPLVVTPAINPNLEHYKKAVALAEQAAATAETTASTYDLSLLQQEQALWQAALTQLSRIPSDSPLYDRAIAKQTAYRQNLAAIKSRVAQTNQTFLTNIVQAAETDPNKLHITLCQLPAPKKSKKAAAQDLPCSDHQGDLRLASAASLIKLPIAVALASKAETNDIDLDDLVFIDPDNFTENSSGATEIEPGRKYPLRKVMDQMIEGSDNIATNQLIDYLGYDYINQVMEQLNYAQTAVGHKLVGSEIMPFNFGDGTNQATTDEITAMMVEIYNSSKVSDQEILAALSNQKDRELGYEALRELGPEVEWLGEKTGQNDLVLASTLAMRVDKERYILTVAMDENGDTYALRQIISQTAAQLSKTGPLR